MAGTKANGNGSAIGEVISASITGMVVESWQRQDRDGLPYAWRPRFGSFLKAESEEDGLSIIGVVYNVITGPADTSHKAQALGLTREQLKIEQPHIFALLRTEIHAVHIGYVKGGVTFQHLPPHPPQVHDFVLPLPDPELVEVTESLEFLRLVAGVAAVPADELLAAAVREAFAVRKDDRSFLIRAGQALSYLYRDDYDRLIAVLGKIRP